MTDQLFATLQSVRDEASFLAFARALLADREEADGAALTFGGFQGEWANHSIAAFIEGAVAWAEDSDFGVRPVAPRIQIPGLSSPLFFGPVVAMNSPPTLRSCRHATVGHFRPAISFWAFCAQPPLAAQLLRRASR